MNTTLWTIFYIVATSLLIFYFVKEKKIEAKRKEKFTKKIDELLTKANLFMGTERNIVVKTIDGTISLILVIILVLFIQKFYIGNFTVPTPSMEPTVKVKERFFGNMLTPKFKVPERNSIVIFREPKTDKLRYTKRLVALPGEEIQISDNGYLLINGQVLENKREYSQLGSMGTNKWVVPKKGDRIKVEEATFMKVSEEMSFKELSKKIIENGIPDGESFSTKKIEFTVNGKKYTDGLFSAITDMDERLKLLRGETLVKNNNRFKIVGGQFYWVELGVDLKRAQELIAEDKDVHLELDEGKFTLNGDSLTGPIFDREILTELIKGDEVTLQDDYYFMLGDNTNNSSDSRFWGFVKRDRILGTLILRYWPLSEMGVMVGK